MTKEDLTLEASKDERKESKDERKEREELEVSGLRSRFITWQDYGSNLAGCQAQAPPHTKFQCRAWVPFSLPLMFLSPPL